MSENSPDHKQSKINLPLVIGGVVLLGAALVLILFGGSFFGSGDSAQIEEGSSILEQVPAFEPAERETAVLPSGGGPLRVGMTAPDFTLQDLDGNSHTLSQLRGQPVIVNFWATWCAPCRIEMPELQATFEAYQDEGLVILAVDQEESPDAVKSFFVDELGLTFTPLLDTQGEIAQLYGVVNFPTTLFINQEGHITALHRGPMVKSQIDGYLTDTDPTLFSGG